MLMNYLERLAARLGYVRRTVEPAVLPMGVQVDTTIEKDLDYIYKHCGLRAYIVEQHCSFNGRMKVESDPDKRKVEQLLIHYATLGFVFTRSSGYVIGNVRTIPTKDERIQRNRERLQLVASNPSSSRAGR